MQKKAERKKQRSKCEGDWQEIANFADITDKSMAYKKTRSPNHDYHSRSIYLISINKAANVPIFAILQSGSRASGGDADRSASSSAVGEDAVRITNTAIGEIIIWGLSSRILKGTAHAHTAGN